MVEFCPPVVEFRSADWARLGVAGDDDLGYWSMGKRGDREVGMRDLVDEGNGGEIRGERPKTQGSRIGASPRVPVRWLLVA